MGLLKSSYRVPRSRKRNSQLKEERLALAVEGRRQAQKLVWSIASAENAELTAICVNLRNLGLKFLCFCVANKSVSSVKSVAKTM